MTLRRAAFRRSTLSAFGRMKRSRSAVARASPCRPAPQIRTRRTRRAAQPTRERSPSAVVRPGSVVRSSIRRLGTRYTVQPVGARKGRGSGPRAGWWRRRESNPRPLKNQRAPRADGKTLTTAYVWPPGSGPAAGVWRVRVDLAVSHDQRESLQPEDASRTGPERVRRWRGGRFGSRPRLSASPPETPRHLGHCVSIDRPSGVAAA